jgi:hypothetical protein
VFVTGFAIGLPTFGSLKPEMGLHVNVTPPVAFKLVGVPWHIVTSGPASAVGSVFTVTVVAAVFVQVPFETVSVYVPAIAIVALFETLGFCKVLLKPSGPVQLYEVIPLSPPVRAKASPIQIGPLFKAVAVGIGTTNTLAWLVDVDPFASVTVTIYKVVVVGETTGLASVDVNPAGVDDHK